MLVAYLLPYFLGILGRHFINIVSSFRLYVSAKNRIILAEEETIRTEMTKTMVLFFVLESVFLQQCLKVHYQDMHFAKQEDWLWEY